MWWTLVALLSFGAQSVHWTIVAHHVCAEHGELVHGEDDHAHTGDAHEQDTLHSAVSAHGTDGHADATAEHSDDADDDHGHCDAFTDDASSCAVGPAGLTASAQWGLVDWQPTHFVPVRRLFLLAPKNSPPVAA